VTVRGHQLRVKAAVYAAEPRERESLSLHSVALSRRLCLVNGSTVAFHVTLMMAQAGFPNENLAGALHNLAMLCSVKSPIE
jgi:hypothetical protein